MNCPEHLLLKAFWGRLWVYVIYLDVPRKTVPLSVWLNPLRYEVSINLFGYHKFNEGGKASIALANWLYKSVRPKLCKWFGIHQRFSFVGGEKRCHHCDIGNDSDA